MAALFIYLKSSLIAAINFVIAIAHTTVQVMIAAPYAYLSAVWAGAEDPFWPHVILVPLSVFAGIAVGAGIVLERPKYSPKVHQVALWLVVFGVAVESVCTVSLFVIDERISGAQQSTIIALQKRIAVRQLDGGEQTTVANMIRAFAPQKFMASIGQGVGDGSVFWQSLAPAFSKAGWEYVKPGPNNFALGDPPANVAIAAGPDVEILLPPSTVATPRMVEAATTLALALRNVGIWAYPNFDPNTNNTTMIQIRIGVKTR